MVEGVDVIGTSITGDKQITLVFRHNGQGNSPDITIHASAIKFQFQEFTKMFGDIIENMGKGNIFSNANWLNQVNNDFSVPFAFETPSKVSGISKVKMGWTSPITVNVNLSGDTTLKDTNVTGIRILKGWRFAYWFIRTRVLPMRHHY